MASEKHSLQLWALGGFPLVEPGDDIVAQILQTLESNELTLRNGDVIAIAQKVISKAENCYREFSAVEPTDEAIELAKQVEKDPRLVQLILDESVEVVRTRPGVLIVEHRLGLVHANAGIDQSNIQTSEADQRALLLPADPDASAADVRQKIHAATGIDTYVLINDSAGRAWRNGTSGIAIGTAGFESLNDLIGETDMFDNELRVTTVGVADELAAAASFMMGQANEATPVVVIRGANLKPSESSNARDLVRCKELDLFR